MTNDKGGRKEPTQKGNANPGETANGGETKEAVVKEDLPETVTLVNEGAPEKKREREFSIADAKRTLAYEEKNGLSNWKLKEDSGLTFKNGTFSRANIGENKDA